MEFDRRKTAAIAAINSPEPDNSPKGNLDAPVVPLINAINSHPHFFTTSSCSGRISIFSHPTATTNSAVKKKSKGGAWIFVSHEPVHPSSILPLLFSNSTQKINSPESIVFRFEPLIIAVECRDIDAAQLFVSRAIACGFRESGITSVSKRVIVAIRCSIRMEVPLGEAGKLIVSPEYVEYLIGVANEKMEANRKRTDVFFEAFVKDGFSGNGIRVNENGAEECKILENGVEVHEGEFGSESNGNHDADCGSHQDSHINLSVIKTNGEPLEKLFLWGHSSCAFDQTKVLIFGGFGGIGRHERRNDLLLLDTNSGSLETIAVTGPAPCARLGHTCSVIGDLVYVIGGRADPMNILNEVWIFNKVKKEWKIVECSGSFFGPRHRHASAVVNSKIYIFGGTYDDAILSSLYVLDTLTLKWTKIEKTDGAWPGPHHSSSMGANGSKLYMFGGYNGEKALGDMHTFDTKSGLWKKMETNGKAPNARFSHLMFIYSNYLGIFGGCPVSKNQELFLLDLKSNSWRIIWINSIQEELFVRTTANILGDNLIIIGGGAACYAFGTKFSEPMKIDLLHLNSSFDNLDCQAEEKTEEKVNGCADRPWVLKLDKKYAKLGKDMLKKFGWLDLERKVYSLEGNIGICFPVTENFGSLFEEKIGGSGDECELPADIKDISESTALNLLTSLGATKILDKVVKAKKTLNSPFKVMKEAVASLLNDHDLPSELVEQVPLRWEKLGDIIVLPVTSFGDQMWDKIGHELWPIIAQSLGTRRLARQARVAATGTRDSKLEILVGDDGWVDHRENGIIYSFDTTKCMFSWGNLSEKLRMANLDCRDQVIVDLFSGIGYFTLPFLIRANAKLVYACEWNPNAIEALRRNLHANSVADRCIVLEGDNRITAPKGVADRVCLGLLPTSEGSWVTAVRALRDEGGILHIHGNVKDTEEGVWTDHVVQSISNIAKSQGRLWEVSVEHVERVKWYAPHIRHLVVDVRCRKSKIQEKVDT